MAYLNSIGGGIVFSDKYHLLNAVKVGNVEKVKSLLAKEIDFNALDYLSRYSDYYGKTALYIAAEDGKKEIVKLLLNHKKTDVNVMCNGKTILHHIAEKGDVEVLTLLLNHKRTDTNAKSISEKTALHYAIENGNTEIVKLLLKYDIDVNTKDRYGNAALHYAILNDHQKITFLLLIYGFDYGNESKVGDELKESLIIFNEIKAMPNSGKLIEINKSKSIEDNTNVVLGFIKDEAKGQELIKEFKAIKNRRPYERLFFILEYLLDFVKHIFLKIFTKNKKTIATQLCESKNDIEAPTEDGATLKNLPYEAAERIASYFDADTNKCVSLDLSKKVDAFLIKLKEAIFEEE